MTAVGQNQARVMLALQSKMNSKVEQQWIQVKFPYLRAVVIEGAEAMEHHGWKWWKKQNSDLAQLQMEVIDIWHFILSELLIKTSDNQEQATSILMAINEIDDTSVQIKFDGQNYALSSLDLLGKLELLIGISVARRMELLLFRAIMLDCGLNWDTLFQQYVSKNVLNFFRQDHGYKEGTYAKLWMGKEDNEHLVEIMGALNPQDVNYSDQLYRKLEERYPYQQSAV